MKPSEGNPKSGKTGLITLLRIDYWKKSFYQNKFAEIDLPVLHISGWYDDDLIGTHINYVGMKEKSASERSRKNQKLIIGPWPHHVNGSQNYGRDRFWGVCPN